MIYFSGNPWCTQHQMESIMECVGKWSMHWLIISTLRKQILHSIDMVDSIYFKVGNQLLEFLEMAPGRWPVFCGNVEGANLKTNSQDTTHIDP